jgi:hypothetical protein
VLRFGVDRLKTKRNGNGAGGGTRRWTKGGGAAASHWSGSWSRLEQLRSLSDLREFVGTSGNENILF